MTLTNYNQRTEKQRENKIASYARLTSFRCLKIIYNSVCLESGQLVCVCTGNVIEIAFFYNTLWPSGGTSTWRFLLNINILSFVHGCVRNTSGYEYRQTFRFTSSSIFHVHFCKSIVVTVLCVCGVFFLRSSPPPPKIIRSKSMNIFVWSFICIHKEKRL